MREEVFISLKHHNLKEKNTDCDVISGYMFADTVPLSLIIRFLDYWRQKMFRQALACRISDLKYLILAFQSTLTNFLSHNLCTWAEFPINMPQSNLLKPNSSYFNEVCGLMKLYSWPHIGLLVDSWCVTVERSLYYSGQQWHFSITFVLRVCKCWLCIVSVTATIFFHFFC